VLTSKQKAQVIEVHLGVTLSKEDVKNIVNAFDTNGDGELLYNAFVKMLAASVRA
jgi:Ca2+-binding EF-hand superfamily protein